MAEALSDDRKKDIRGFRDEALGLTFVVVDDVEDFLLDEVMPICESADAIGASQFFVEFCKDLRKHFFEKSKKSC